MSLAYLVKHAKPVIYIIYYYIYKSGKAVSRVLLIGRWHNDFSDLLIVLGLLTVIVIAVMY